MVAVSDVKPNPLNPRLDLDVSDILESVKSNGVHTAILVNKDFVTYRGHRRTIAARAAGLTEIPAIVFDDTKLSEGEKYELLLDHSGEKPLNKAEAFRAIQHFFLLGYGELAVIRKAYAILNLAFGAPSSDKLAEARIVAERQHENADEAESKVIETKHRGTVQHMKRLALLPSMVADEYCKTWSGKPSLITQNDVKTLDKVWNELWKADPSVKRDNPPASFVDKFEEIKLVNASKDSEEAGSLKKRTNAEIQDMLKACEDAKVRLTLQWVLGEGSRQTFIDSIKKLG
jgi:hypothetical protein